MCYPLVVNKINNITQPAQADTECKQTTFGFQALGKRRVEVDFSGGHLSSDGGALLLREVDRRLGLAEKLAACFTDRRDPRLLEHPAELLIRQRIFGLALGYEDLNDHDNLRRDPLMATACGKIDLLGEERRCEEDKGRPLAGKSTLNRLELSSHETDGRYKKIQADPEAIKKLLIEAGVRAIPRKTRVIVIDFDATDDPLHGKQEGRFFHGYYRHYCYLPLYAFCGDIPLWAELRTADRDGSDGTKEALEEIIPVIRRRFGRKVPIIVRGDSGFCREELMAWIEQQPRVHYVFGLAKNSRLTEKLEKSFEALEEGLKIAEETAQDTPATTRCFVAFRYRTLKSWSRARRVIGKAEITGDKRNPRFIVTDLRDTDSWPGDWREKLGNAQALYEKFYCARGDMENRIKEQQLDLFADRTSTAHLKSNQLRLWFSTFAYLLLSCLRTLGLKGTRYARATVGTIRLRLMKIAAQLTVSVRRVYVRLCSSCPDSDVFAAVHRNLLDPSG